MNTKIAQITSHNATAVLLLLGAFVFTRPLLVQAQFLYTIKDDATITVTDYTGPGGAVNIPSTIEGRPVTRIGDYAFNNESTLTSVTIPNSVESLGDWAFAGCTSLTSVSISDSVRGIGHGAFASCTSLTNLTIPNSVISLGDRTFDYCIGLTSITIPDSVTFIGFDAFSNCTGLKAIEVQALNPSYDSVEGVLFDKNRTKLIRYPEGKAGTVTIPNSVTTIEGGAFSGCTGLKAIEVEALNSAYGSVEGVLFNNARTTLLICPEGKVGNFTVPSSVTTIAPDAFSSCTGLTGVTIPNSVTFIGSEAFSNCTGLTSVTIPNSVSLIHEGMFNQCKGLTSVVIPNSVTHLQEDVFRACTSLTGVYFQGNAPGLGGDEDVFSFSDQVHVYYLPGTTGWTPNFARRPTALWSLPYPVILGSSPGIGAPADGFGFLISWANKTAVVVEASSDLAASVWTPVSTNTLTGGTVRFNDPNWAQYPTRLYRLIPP